VNDTERYLFLALIEAVQDIEVLFHSVAHRHQALLVVLRDKGTITSKTVRRRGEGAPGRRGGGAGLESGVVAKAGGARRAEAGARARALDGAGIC
jgi:hypothetical protein